jgi:lysophospholipid acyltransferase (LPLAT)-like uncharacterized protein
MLKLQILEEWFFMERLLEFKKIKRKILSFIVPPFVFILINLIFFTTKRKYHIASNIPNEPVMFALWHGKILMLPFLYRKIRVKVKVATIISDHFDGELIAKMVEFFGFESIRGSTTRGSIKVLKESFAKIDSGYDIGITPDGPRGPKESVADGVVAISKKKKLKIVALNYRASSAWHLKSWDSFTIPKPFCTIDFYASEPFDIKNLSMDEAKKIIKERLGESI